jgi:hypothetical protein
VPRKIHRRITQLDFPRGCHISLALILIVFVTLISQSQTPAPSTGRGVVRLKVRVKEDEKNKNLGRKRFFLIKGTLKDNNAWIQLMAQQSPLSRDCYYKQIGASTQLLKWLKENDCESPYCRELQVKDVDGPDAVPEFQRAVADGEAEFKSRETARQWATVHLPENIREGFYKANQQRLVALLAEAEKVSGTKAQSVMTDRLGTAYFTDLEPGPYVISNLLPTEVGNSFVTWNCEVQVKPGDIATEQPFMISNRNERNVKCVGVEKPLPACPGNSN